MQRVAIARALSVNPAIIFADEPTGALDQTTGHAVMRLLMDAARANNASVVLVTHDPNVAAYCSHTVHMRDGMITNAQPTPTAQVARQAPARMPMQAPLQGGAR